jgi:hypothetical protein
MTDRTDNIRSINEHPSARSAANWQQATPELAAALLSSCLALVRPAGMADGDVRDWLSVAVGAVVHLPAAILDRASLEARRTCTHHSQIVPAIIREAEELIERQRRLDRPVVVVPEARRLPPPKLTEEELQYLPAQLRKIGLGAGWLTENEDGSLSWSQESAA